MHLPRAENEQRLRPAAGPSAQISAWAQGKKPRQDGHFPRSKGKNPLKPGSKRVKT
jgi:hypothetical protein